MSLTDAPVIHGRCLCGFVAISLKRPTLLCVHCHCESCRRAHAAAFVTWTAVPEAQFRVVQGEKEVTRYQSSHGAYRCFCKRCGTTMFSYYTEHSPTFADSAGIIYVPAAVLLDGLDQAPTKHLSFEEHVPWLELADGLPRYRGKTDERLG